MTQLIVALDGEPGIETRLMMSRLMAEAGVRWFKVGMPMLMHHEGRRTADFIRHLATKMMLDAKTYDTRDTVLRTVDAAVEMGAAMLTVHADCVIHAADERRLKILSVRRLTDGTAARSVKIGHAGPPAAALAHGVICSVAEAQIMRPHTAKLLVCPGIRPAGWPADNHETAATPALALKAGANFIVVGRPIYAAADPVKAAQAILAELAETPPASPAGCRGIGRRGEG